MSFNLFSLRLDWITAWEADCKHLLSVTLITWKVLDFCEMTLSYLFFSHLSHLLSAFRPFLMGLLSTAVVSQQRSERVLSKTFICGCEFQDSMFVIIFELYTSWWIFSLNFSAKQKESAKLSLWNYVFLWNSYLNGISREIQCKCRSEQMREYSSNSLYNALWSKMLSTVN